MIQNLNGLFIISILSILVLAIAKNDDIYAEPTFKDTNLRAEVVTQGLHSPISMAFLDKDNILVLEKNSGEVHLVSGGILLKQPVLKLDIDHTTLTCCRGLLGIAVMTKNSLAHSQNEIFVFLYYSEQLDGKDSVRNRMYSYTWNEVSLVNPVLIFDLPATPGPNHPGGKVVLGNDDYLYTVIGDLNNEGLLQNVKGKPILL